MKHVFQSLSLALSLALLLSACAFISSPSGQVTTNAPTTEATAASPGVWVRLGGPPGGIGYDIRMRPDNPDIMFVTDVNSGLHKSVDGGKTWYPVHQGMPVEPGRIGPPIFCATIDPHNPDVVWAGTMIIGHLYRSADGGETWQKWGEGREEFGHTIRGITIDPNDPNVMYLGVEVEDFIVRQQYPGHEGTRGQVYKSTDGGRHWQVIWDGENLARYVWIDPRDSNRIYVSTGIFDRGAFNTKGVGILRSKDGGQTWEVLDEKNGLGGRFIPSLFMHPTNPDILVAAVGMQGPHTGVYVTYDRGDTWQAALTPEGGSVEAVEIAEANPNIWYAAGEGSFWRSEDAGKTWQHFRLGTPDMDAGVPIDLQVDPRDPYRIFDNNYGGGNFLSEDGGETWRDASIGYTGGEMRGIAVYPGTTDEVFAGSSTGLFHTEDGGHTWRGAGPIGNRPPLGDSVLTFTDAQGQTVLLVGADGAIWLSRDRGQAWEKHVLVENPEMPGEFRGVNGLSIGRLRAVAVAPSDPNRMYAAFVARDCLRHNLPACMWQTPGFFRSRDGGQTWQQVDTYPFWGDAGVLRLRVHPQDAERVYAATAAGLYVSTDGGDTWEQIASLTRYLQQSGIDPENPLQQGLIFEVLLDPFDPTTIYVGVQGRGVLRSEDGGQTWEDASAGLADPNETVRALVADPNRQGWLYAATENSGVYLSRDGAHTWRQMINGLDFWTVFELALSDDGSTLYAATDGAGAYRTQVPLP